MTDLEVGVMGRIVEREWVKAKDANWEAGSWEPQSFDKVNLILTIRGTWVFEESLDVGRLKESLSEVLSFYPHLVGRVDKNEVVQFTNDGVTFAVEKREDLTIEALRSEHTLAGSCAEKPDRRAFKRGKAPGFVVRVTQLGRGSVLSVSCIHALMDGNSFYSMISNWARLCSGKSFTKPLLDQTLIPGPSLRSKEEVLGLGKEHGWVRPSIWKSLLSLPLFLFGRMLERSRPFFLSFEEIERLRERALEGAGGVELSQNDLLVAFVSSACARLLKHPEGTSCQQVVVVDGRQRFSQLPENFVGNAAFTCLGADFRADASLGEIASRTHEALAPFLCKPSEKFHEQVVLGMDLINHKAFLMPYDLLAVHNKKPTAFYLNNFTKFPIYDVDFGVEGVENRPVLVIPHDLPDPILFWPASPEKRGIEVYFTGSLARVVKAQTSPKAWWRDMLQRTLSA